MELMADSEAEDRLRLLETEIERRLSERFAALRDEFDRLRLETDRRWFGFLERFNQDLKGVVPGELLTPTGEDTPVGRFLTRRGPGMHHVALATGDLLGTVERLEAAGAQLVDRPHVGLFGVEFVFIHPDSVHGVLTEVVASG